MGLWPLHRAFGLKRYFAATYQSVSGTGAEAVRELEAQVQAYAKGEPLPRKVYPVPDRVQRDPAGRHVRRRTATPARRPR